MQVKVPYMNNSNKNEAYGKVKNTITPDLLAKWKVNADLSYKDNQEITAAGKGFTLTLIFEETEIIADLNLSFLLKPLGKKILEKIEHQIKKVV
ncbi:hypothetical protein N9N67_09590 [Bacteriovoracaceae bacterium]|nr:hypothetical protein [Bacteriovoracaceae bacterium]